MSAMTPKIEHAAWQMPDPVAAAEWYVRHLGMKVVREAGPPAHMRFLADATGRTLLEIYNNPAAEVPDYWRMHPLLLHLAFAVDDVAAERDRLVAAGARVVDDLLVTPAGDEMVMLRDPWGLPLQLVHRRQPMPTGK